MDILLEAETLKKFSVEQMAFKAEREVKIDPDNNNEACKNVDNRENELNEKNLTAFQEAANQE